MPTRDNGGPSKLLTALAWAARLTPVGWHLFFVASRVTALAFGLAGEKSLHKGSAPDRSTSQGAQPELSGIDGNHEEAFLGVPPRAFDLVPVDGEKVTRRLGHLFLLVATGQAYRTEFSNLGFLFDFRFANSNPSSDHWTLALFARVSREVEVLSSHAAKCKCLRSLGPRDEASIARTRSGHGRYRRESSDLRCKRERSRKGKGFKEAALTVLVLTGGRTEPNRSTESKYSNVLASAGSGSAEPSGPLPSFDRSSARTLQVFRRVSRREKSG